jgi:excisionase family DNA binding protein
MQVSSEHLTTAQVAAIFSVHPQTVTKWAVQGLLPHLRTPGGHRRYKREDVDRMRAALTVDAAPGGSAA